MSRRDPRKKRLVKSARSAAEPTAEVARHAKPKPKASSKPATKQQRQSKRGSKVDTEGSSSRAKVVLLAGGNPQIAKGDGDEPVEAYIAAMPGWKCAVGRRLDAVIVRSFPAVRKAVKWNSPFYGIPGKGWFLGIHCFDRYVKVAFFEGRALRPMPPGESKDPNARYLDIREGDTLDEARLASWVRQASRLSGWGKT